MKSKEWYPLLLEEEMENPLRFQPVPHCHLSLPSRPVASHACCGCARPQLTKYCRNYHIRDAPRCGASLRRKCRLGASSDLWFKTPAPVCPLEKRNDTFLLPFLTSKCQTLIFLQNQALKKSGPGRFNGSSEFLLSSGASATIDAQAPKQAVKLETAPAWRTSAARSARTSSRQPHSGTFFHVPTVEDSHIATQEDIAEDP